MASEKILTQKKDEVKKLADKIKKAKAVILADYRGINVEDVTALRSKLRVANTEYAIIKNNITKRAMEECRIDGLTPALIGPTAVILGNDDYLETSKIIYDYSKDHDSYKIKGGIIDGKVLSADEIVTLAKLPSREVLIAQLAGALLGNITKLAVGLNEVMKQKEAA